MVYDEGDVLVAEPRTRQTEVQRVEELIADPMIAAEAVYSNTGWFLFIVDVTPKPKEIIFRHVKTGEIVHRSRNSEVLERFRYH